MQVMPGAVAIPDTVAEPGIVVDALSHWFSRGAEVLHVIDVFSLSVPQGQFVALIGPSGCGKTTVLDILTGLVPVQQGEVRVGGLPPRAGRRDTARMFARDALLPWRSATGNIDFALSTREPDRATRHRGIRDLLEAVGLADFAGSYPGQLSQGMRQRVALARTFALHSQFLFLDEPFGALDAQTKLILQDLLLRLWEQNRNTVLLVTHDLAEAVALSDRVIVMSARPGVLMADVPIDLPRPRSVTALQKLREYHDLYARLWTELERAAGFQSGAPR